jgi:hypothetical protein
MAEQDIPITHAKTNGRTKPFIYTEEFVLSELNDMLIEVRNDLGMFFVGQLFENRNYSRQRFSEWEEKFKDNAEITDTKKRIEELLETRLVTGGLTSALNPTLTIFSLKNKHNWKDAQQQDIKIENVTPILGGTTKNALSAYNSDQEVIEA